MLFRRNLAWTYASTKNTISYNFLSLPPEKRPINCYFSGKNEQDQYYGRKKFHFTNFLSISILQ